MTHYINKDLDKHSDPLRDALLRAAGKEAFVVCEVKEGLLIGKNGVNITLETELEASILMIQLENILNKCKLKE